jgi:transcriptional regulator GlxA family with amidase domain
MLEGPVDNDLVRSILGHVEANLEKPLDPDSLATRFNVSQEPS